MAAVPAAAPSRNFRRFMVPPGVLLNPPLCRGLRDYGRAGIRIANRSKERARADLCRRESAVRPDAGYARTSSWLADTSTEGKQQSRSRSDALRAITPPATPGLGRHGEIWGKLSAVFKAR